MFQNKVSCLNFTHRISFSTLLQTYRCYSTHHKLPTAMFLSCIYSRRLYHLFNVIYITLMKSLTQVNTHNFEIDDSDFCSSLAGDSFPLSLDFCSLLEKKAKDEKISNN